VSTYVYGYMYFMPAMHIAPDYGGEPIAWFSTTPYDNYSVAKVMETP
jgi:hypothetical protein